jgi:hypothetical protein
MGGISLVWEWRRRSLFCDRGDRALPKPKKPGFFEPLCLDTDILAKTRFLTRAVSRCAQTQETGFFRAPLPRHRYLGKNPVSQQPRSAQTQESGFFRAPLPRHRYLGKNPVSQPRPLPKQKKPGFFEPLCLDTNILCKNPVSHQSRITLGSNPRNRVFSSPFT